jgi:hypothetical protein
MSITFYGDVLFELSSVFPNVHSFSKMQGMDKKYNGHVGVSWSQPISRIILG